jgi:predicted GIY-YIG superfamily endonuclease
MHWLSALRELDDGQCAIYALIDPRNSLVRYIGATSNPLRRLRSHVHDSRAQVTPKDRWIAQLVFLEMLPEMKILMTCDECVAGFYEEKHIEIYNCDGLLFNVREQPALPMVRSAVIGEDRVYFGGLTKYGGSRHALRVSCHRTQRI